MIPKTLKYGSKVESAVARSSRINIAPQNGTSTYGLGDTIIINLPTRNNLVLVPTESYLKFNCKFTSAVANNAFRLDSCGIHGIFQRIRVFHGSNLLQDIDNYGLLAKMLFDLQQPTDATYGKMSMLAGTRTDLTVTSAQAAYAQNSVYSAVQTNSGERVGGAPAALLGNAGTVNDTYCVNLISLVGSLCSANYIPLFGMTSAPLRVEIQLVDTLYKGVSVLSSTGAADAGTLSITNCEYVANFIELGDQAMSVIVGSLEGQPLQFVVPDFRNYQYSLSLTQNVSTQVAFPIPAKFSSLKAILVAARDKGTGTFGGFFPFSSVTNGLTDYQFRVGSQIMPPKPPSTNAEFFSEVLKAMGSIGDINYQPSIDKTSYSITTSAASNDTAAYVSSTSSGSFFVGLDLENYCGASKDTIFAGYNSNTDDIFWIANFTTPNATGVVRFDAYANFDSVVVCDNNTAYVKF